MRKTITSLPFHLVFLAFMSMFAFNAKSQTETEKEEIFTFAEQMPQFPGKMDDLREFIHKNLKYPDLAKENGIEGKIIMRFVVDKNGKIGQIEQLSTKAGWGLDDEAKRVIEIMPDWIPGKQNGKPINCYYTLPIKFQINKSKK